MKHNKKKSDKHMHSIFGVFIRAELSALALTLGLIAICAYLLFQGVLKIDSLSIVNPVIKALGALAAAIIVSCMAREKRFIMCCIAGAGHTLLAYVILSLIVGSFTFGTGLLIDVGIGILAGAVVAVIMK